MTEYQISWHAPGSENVRVQTIEGDAIRHDIGPGDSMVAGDFADGSVTDIVVYLDDTEVFAQRFPADVVVSVEVDE